MIDTHCHLQTDAYDEDRAAVLVASRTAGVQAFVVPAIDHESFAATLALTTQPDVYCALGIHPHSADQWSGEIADEIETAVHANPKIVAVGEIGLDYHYDFAPRDVQKRAFAEQIQLAIHLAKPIVIHTRESDDDVLAIIGEHYRNASESVPRGQFHCFSGSVETLGKALELGFYVSFTGNITFKKSILGEVVAAAPLERIMLETDSPYMTPVPNRGKRNTPASVRQVAEKIAEIKQIDIAEVMNQTTKNALRLFKLAAFAFVLLTSLASSNAWAQRTEPVGSRPPDSVMTDDRRKMEEAVRKQREELQKEEEARRQDSIRAAMNEQQEAIRQAAEQLRQDSVKAAQKIADEEKERLRAQTPIAWKAIGIGGGIGIGNMQMTQQKSTITPTSVLETSFQLGTQISRVLDFQFSYASLKVGDDLTGDKLYNNGLNFRTGPQPVVLSPGNLIPIHEDLTITSLAFDLRFLITPRAPFKFYAGIGYTLLKMENNQQYKSVVAGSNNDTVIAPTINTYDASFNRGSVKVLFGIRYDFEIGNQFILTPFAEISALGAFSGANQLPPFVFRPDEQQITMTHFTFGATLYFGWFGIKRYE